MDPERIWVTVFGGDEELGLGPDEEAIEIWRGVGVPDERIVRLGREDNFWQAGPTGPCGPCSELYLDRGLEFGAEGDRPGDDTDRFLEFWNHVFMSYDLAEDGSLTELPMRNIDTGMGLDRMAAILQDVPSVFETDLVRPLIDLAEELSGRSYDEGGAVTRAMRIVADHSRGAAFLIADGVVPSNEDRGYILRRIMRRAIQQGRTLGLEAPWLGRFAERTIEIMGDAYPELVAERETIARWVGDEEESFGRTLERGTELLERLIAEAKEAETSWIDAADAFKLHDTYGFPYDLTKELLAEQGLSVDDGGFEELMEEQRQRARTGAATAHGSEDRHETRARLRRRRRRRPRFVGYETLRATTGLAAVAGRRRPRPGQARGEPLLRRGRRPGRRLGRAALGRAARRGSSTSTASATTRRSRSSRAAARSTPGVAGRGRGRPRGPPRDDAQPHRDPPAARGAARAARHPRAPGRLGRAPRQAALRLHPRPGARRRGAARVEDRVNEWIKASRPVRWLEMERAEAERLGAMALFGEKYGEWVRVVEVDGVSRELCGGTHVANTAEIGIFKIASEGSSAANVRRIEALTGPAAIDWFREREERAARGRRAARLPAGPARRRPPRGRAAERGRARAPKQAQRSSCSATRPSGWPASAEEIGGVKAVVAAGAASPTRSSCSSSPTASSRSSAATRRSSSAAPRASKVGLVALVSKDAVGARALGRRRSSREAAPVVGGGGGGRDDMAQAGGKDPAEARRGAGGGARAAIEREARLEATCACSPSTTAPPGSAARSPTRAAPWRRRCR